MSCFTPRKIISINIITNDLTCINLLNFYNQNMFKQLENWMYFAFWLWKIDNYITIAFWQYTISFFKSKYMSILSRSDISSNQCKFMFAILLVTVCPWGPESNSFMLCMENQGQISWCFRAVHMIPTISSCLRTLTVGFVWLRLLCKIAAWLASVVPVRRASWLWWL